MSKSIKLKNNNFLDSSGIVHNKKTLNDLIPHFFNHHDQIDERDLNAILAPGIYQLGYNYRKEKFYG